MSAIHDSDGEDDQEGIDFVSGGGFAGAGGAENPQGGLPNLTMLIDAAEAIKSNEISMDEFVSAVKKVQTLATNALKLYAIPAVKKDLPGKLTEKQNELWSALEAQFLRIQEGTETMLAYSTNNHIGDLEAGLDAVVKAFKSAVEIQRHADSEYAEIMQREKEEKAARAQKAAQANSAS